jgi:hypothetical protein
MITTKKNQKKKRALPHGHLSLAQHPQRQLESPTMVRLLSVVVKEVLRLAQCQHVREMCRHLE